jgi:prevent-host-death family protein
MKRQTISVTKFKATCLALLDDIASRGGTLTITKRGRPLATVAPAAEVEWRSPEGSWAKKVRLTVDPLDVDTTDLWEVAAKAGRERR